MSSQELLDSAAAIAFSDPTDGFERQMVFSFTSGQSCRTVLNQSGSSLQVIITPNVPDVQPLNLAAALSREDHNRDVYLIDDVPSSELVGRAKAANIRGIITHDEARELLNLGAEPDSCHAQMDCQRFAQATPLSPQEQRRAAMTEPCHPRATAQPSVRSEATNETLGIHCSEQSDEATLNMIFEDLSSPVESEGESEPNAGVTVLEPPTVETPALKPPTSKSSYIAYHPERSSSPLPEPGEPVEGERGQVLGFVSARGGVGKSTLSLLSAIAAAKQDKRVILADLDLQFGDLGYLIGHEQGFVHSTVEMVEALAMPQTLDTQTGSVTLIKSPALPEDAERVLPQIGELLCAAQAKADLVLVNTGSFWDRLQITLAQVCAHLVFVVDQRATSIQGCKQAMELCVRLRIPSTKLAFILNRCSNSAPLSTQDVALALGGVEVQQVMDGGCNIDELLALGCPDEALRASDSLSGSLIAALGKILTVEGSDDFANWCLRPGKQPGKQKESGLFSARKQRGW